MWSREYSTYSLEILMDSLLKKKQLKSKCNYMWKKGIHSFRNANVSNRFLCQANFVSETLKPL